MSKITKSKTAHLKPHQFKKGAPSANPHGRIANPAIKALKNLTLDTYREVIEVVLTGNIEMLQDIIKDPTASAIKVGVANSFLQAIKKGDYLVIERIAERIVGKIPEVVNINSNSNINAEVKVGALDKEKLKAAYKKLENDV